MKYALPRLMLIAACLLVMPTFAGVEIAVAQSNLKKCPKSQNARWHNCFGTYTAENGGKYVGEFKDDKANGQGTFTHGEGQHKGEVYVGEFKDGKLNGRGTYTWSDGANYSGES